LSKEDGNILVVELKHKFCNFDFKHISLFYCW